MPPPSLQSRDVHLSVPARPDYLVLARLALSAMCRLTPLEHAEVADLKLAITEAASRFVADSQPPDSVVDFEFRLLDDRIEMTLDGAPVGTPAEEQEVSRAIVEATVDEFQLRDGHVTLVKRFAA
ncbi:MAG: ATP-binding protein [Actinomycetota bacterium]|nr:ATP-binding protein [Actinomycetota bacterium]